ncbi:hypothetical protein [Microbacterium sp. 18062]|uniref:hypothetical protein n=1 Tax=Microbacterium sp. 18062 TaxID=2681410 RepID=UPI001356FD05|nr:hypothetical protein [Microbacterium sp. 18062]
MAAWRGGAGVAAVLGIGLLSGCGVILGVGAQPRPDATPTAELTCADPLDGSAERPAAGAVPAGFDPVAFYRCDPLQTTEDDAGIWSGALVTRFEGDLDPLLRALAEPDDARWLGACTTIG